MTDIHSSNLYTSLKELGLPFLEIPSLQNLIFRMEEGFNALNHSENKIILAAWVGLSKDEDSDQLGLLFLRHFGFAFIGVDRKKQCLSSVEIPYNLISGLQTQKEILTDLTQAIIVKTPQGNPYIFKGMKGMIPSSFIENMRKIELID